MESKLVSEADIELEFYENFFLSRDLEPYPVQEEAFTKIFAGESALISVPTGTGKTLMAKAGIMRALRMGKTAIYTTPLRALTEEKYRELCEDFGEDNVGFATGDYKVNPEAKIQVLVAEILWNRIYSDQVKRPADIVIMDEGHYFNDHERGYVWEQSIIGLHPESQLVILSATIGGAQQFCQWVYVTRGVKMALVSSTERRVPLYHRFEERYLIEVVKELFAGGEYPAIVFSFSRNGCFEWARLLRSCPRFVDKDEQAEIKERSKDVLLETGLGPSLEKLLQHGIGVHHSGILPAYRRLVEELTVDRLLKFIVTTETIAAGINLPAKRVIFPSERKYIRGEARLLYPAEYHQMAGRAGRPQFDKEGIAIALAPEQIVQDFRKEIRDLKKKGVTPDEGKIKKKYYSRAKTEARTKKDVTWDAEIYQKLVDGEPAPLVSKTKITAGQILAIGLPDLTEEALPGEQLIETPEPEPVEAAEGEEGAEVPQDQAPKPRPEPKDEEKRRFVESLQTSPSEHRRLNIRTVIDHLLLPPHLKWEAHKRLAMITKNLQALGVLDERGRQVKGEMIGQIRGADGLFVYYTLTNHELTPELYRELVELLIDHEVIWRKLRKKDEQKIKDWIRERLRERRREGENVSWEDVEAEYHQEHPPEPSPVELIHQGFTAIIPHPELHGGKVFKNIWAQMDDEDMSFLDFVEKHGLDQEEGNLFTYLARVMKTARMLNEVTEIAEFQSIETAIRHKLGAIDPRVLEGLW